MLVLARVGHSLKLHRNLTKNLIAISILFGLLTSSLIT